MCFSVDLAEKVMYNYFGLKRSKINLWSLKWQKNLTRSAL